MPKDFKQNKHCLLNTVVRAIDKGWVSKNTAILIIHGIGTQLPVGTLDQFGRGLVKQYKKQFGQDLKLTHKVVKKAGGSGVWFDNVLRIQKEGDPYYIDLYEYYWANYTQDKATWKDLNKWLQGVVDGANSFYKRNATLGKQYKDQSLFFDTRTGDFKVGLYRAFLATAANALFIIDQLYKALVWLVGRIPLLGKAADSLLENYLESKAHNIINIISEVAIYNVVDPKSKFYEVRRKIQDGAVSAVKYLLEKQVTDDEDYENDKKLAPGTEPEIRAPYYPSVIVAGHSLGSQVGYDAINRINLLANKSEIRNYHYTGLSKWDNSHISQQLNGFITFGSPLDKIVFFLRENVPDSQYLRQQILDDYHGFKQRELDGQFNNTRTNKAYVKVDSRIERLLENVQWRNYFDDKDYVSGGLDYYYQLTNINCQFKGEWFTHSCYWDCENFFADIINHYLVG